MMRQVFSLLAVAIFLAPLSSPANAEIMTYNTQATSTGDIIRLMDALKALDPKVTVAFSMSAGRLLVDANEAAQRYAQSVLGRPVPRGVNE